MPDIYVCWYDNYGNPYNSPMEIRIIPRYTLWTPLKIVFLW